MNARVLPVGASAALLASCVVAVPVDVPGKNADLAPLAADRSEPRLALVEHLLADYFASDISSPPTVCAAISDGRSETALPAEQEIALIERFAQLAPFSRCSWNGKAWEDSETGMPALVFTLHEFSCASDTQCAGWASYTAGGTVSPSALYTMTYAGGSWSIERDRRLIMD